VDARDAYTWGHSERVARMGVRIAREMRRPESEVSDLYLGGLLHDIGKIGIRDDVLSKPGALTEQERALVEKHTVIGDAILSHVGQLAHLRPMVRNHHERFDGHGYPDRLAGAQIPLPARILAIADSCDAMLSDRPYRPGMPPSRIDSILREGAGSQWDPEVVAFFFCCRDDVHAVHQQGVGDSVARAVERAVNSSHPRPGPFSLSEISIGGQGI
jgi:HD-GYP domain-containing protein (c-di-GMP phosphodiesterase class II)